MKLLYDIKTGSSLSVIHEFEAINESASATWTQSFANESLIYMSYAYELPLITLIYIHQATQNLLKETNGNRPNHSTFLHFFYKCGRGVFD